MDATIKLISRGGMSREDVGTKLTKVREAMSEKVNVTWERDFTEAIEQQGEPFGLHKLFDGNLLAKAMGQLTDEGKVAAARMRISGSQRKLVPVPDDFRRLCDELTADFPNFQDYIESILIPNLALSRARANSEDRYISLLPTVFLGPPGVGKTLFASALATKLGMEFERLNLETSQAAFELVGSSRGWSSSQPGRLFNWLAGCESANGIFVCEELDKASSDPRWPTLNALIQLLEPSTSAEFTDKSLPEVKLDLRRINWLFTANSLAGLSAPLLSRLHVVEIPSLSAEQARRVALNQYTSILKNLNLSCEVPTPQLTEHGLEVLQSESPRRQRLLLLAAIGRAVADKKNELYITNKSRSKPRMGFI